MIVKVCGMRQANNIRQVSSLGADWMGFIFYLKSPRYIADNVDNILTCPIKKVGVFVDATTEEMIEAASQYKLDYLQLHGNESADTCYTLQKRGLSIIKAFAVETEDDLKQTADYEGRVDYFLFDTKCSGYGGSGRRFDWSILNAYDGDTPFLLSGGIDAASKEAIWAFRHPRFAGIDLNSGFEIAPGLKEVSSLQSFIQEIKKIVKKNNMNRITQRIETKKSGILSVYFTAGYPRLNDTVTVLKELQAKGVDMVEIGIPFSDPMADGPVIQEASTQSLRNGMSLRLLFEQLKEVRKEIQIPIVLMGYLNPIMQFGFESFCQACAEVGVDGMIIPDLPFADYISDYKATAEKYGLKTIMLITPETSEERIRLIDANTSGFIYMVSSAATTGTQLSFDEQKQAYFKRINSMNLNNPRLIGFGISNKSTYDSASANASGVIIGSKFVQLLNTEPTIKTAVEKLLDSIQ